jgi:epoxyqueuosine reductase
VSASLQTDAPQAEPLQVSPSPGSAAAEDPIAALSGWVRQLGFVRWGVAEASEQAFARAQFEHWVARGFHGEMRYLEQPRASAEQLLPGARSVLVVALAYGASQVRDGAAVAAYARGTDYHFVFKSKLRQLAQHCADVLGRSLRARVCVDTAPFLERAWAQQAGVGFTGKSTLTIAPGVGSALLLGELILDVALPPSQPVAEGCGSCRLCLEACPTGAFVDAYTLDARRCISYLTIEYAGSIPLELRPLIGERVFGCDECQRVCPYNESRKLPPAAPELAAEVTLDQDFVSLLTLTSGGYRRWVNGSSRARTSRRQLQRNAAVALGNRRRPQDVPALAEALAHNPYPLVRQHVAWALGRMGTPAALAALHAAAQTEPEPSVCQEIALALAQGQASG